MEEIEFEGRLYVKAVEVDSLAGMSSKAFQLNIGEQGGCDGFVVCEEDGALRAYRNSCPHTGAPLNWTPDQFLTRSGRYIQCSIHGAMFLTETGECFSGPCAGKFLKPLGLVKKLNWVYISVADIQKSPSK